jgi:hypothetical protein
LISAPNAERVTIDPIISPSAAIHAIATSFRAGAEPLQGAVAEASRRAPRQDDVAAVAGMSQLWRGRARRLLRPRPAALEQRHPIALPVEDPDDLHPIFQHAVEDEIVAMDRLRRSLPAAGTAGKRYGRRPRAAQVRSSSSTKESARSGLSSSIQRPMAVKSARASGAKSTFTRRLSGRSSSA